MKSEVIKEIIGFILYVSTYACMHKVINTKFDELLELQIDDYVNEFGDSTDEDKVEIGHIKIKNRFFMLLAMITTAMINIQIYHVIMTMGV